MLERLIGIEEKIFQGLEIPYRIVDTCTGDLGGPPYRKFDIEAWMPGRGEKGEWGEITSASNCTDYQARRLGIRFKEGGGKNPFVHTLNGTALAVSRTLIALLENFQRGGRRASGFLPRLPPTRDSRRSARRRRCLRAAVARHGPEALPGHLREILRQGLLVVLEMVRARVARICALVGILQLVRAGSQMSLSRIVK